MRALTLRLLLGSSSLALADPVTVDPYEYMCTGVGAATGNEPRPGARPAGPAQPE